VDEDGRKKLDNYIREMEGTFPNRDTIYEYYVEPKGKAWIHTPFIGAITMRS
jgi:dynein heavy chain